MADAMDIMKEPRPGSPHEEMAQLDRANDGYRIHRLVVNGVVYFYADVFFHSETWLQVQVDGDKHRRWVNMRNVDSLELESL